MLNAREADAACRALPHPQTSAYNVSKAKRAVQDRLLAAYRGEIDKITDQFREWLGNEYAPTLPEAVQNKVWEKAWSDGHHAGYHEVENYYRQYAEFAEFAINAAK
jgi:hypothetical protein